MLVSHHVLAPILFSLSLFLSACDQGEPSQGGQPEANQAAEVATASGAEPGAASRWQSGSEVPLDVQTAHPNGVVLQITSLQSRETDTAVGVRVVNGNDREVSLNRFNNRDGYIVLPSGERLFLSPPAQNRQLTIQPGQTLEGQLVFLGRLPPVRSAVLVLNENSSTDSQFTRNPSFRIDLPMAAGGATGASQ